MVFNGVANYVRKWVSFGFSFKIPYIFCKRVSSWHCNIIPSSDCGSDGAGGLDSQVSPSAAGQRSISPSPRFPLSSEPLSPVCRNRASFASPVRPGASDAVSIPSPRFPLRDSPPFRTAQDQMERVGHQAKGVYLPARFVARGMERIEKTLSVGVIPKNPFSMVSPANEMVNGAWVFNSEFACHDFDTRQFHC